MYYKKVKIHFYNGDVITLEIQEHEFSIIKNRFVDVEFDRILTITDRNSTYHIVMQNVNYIVWE